jgi:hypothetical protein
LRTAKGWKSSTLNSGPKAADAEEFYGFTSISTVVPTSMSWDGSAGNSVSFSTLKTL